MTMSCDISENTCIKVAKRQISCTVDGEAVILHMDEGVYYGLDPVGTVVWNNLKDGAKFSELQKLVSSEFEVSEEESAADLKELIADLLNRGLVEVQSECGG